LPQGAAWETEYVADQAALREPSPSQNSASNSAKRRVAGPAFSAATNTNSVSVIGLNPRVGSAFADASAWYSDGD